MSRRPRYPYDWFEIAADSKRAAGGKCEACEVPAGPAPAILTVHHLDRDTFNPRNARVRHPHANLVALCQRCHLRAEHWAMAGELLTRDECLERLVAIVTEERAQRSLFDNEEIATP